MNLSVGTLKLAKQAGWVSLALAASYGVMSWYASPTTAFLLADTWLMCSAIR